MTPQDEYQTTVRHLDYLVPARPTASQRHQMHNWAAERATLPPNSSKQDNRDVVPPRPHLVPQTGTTSTRHLVPRPPPYGGTRCPRRRSHTQNHPRSSLVPGRGQR